VAASEFLLRCGSSVAAAHSLIPVEFLLECLMLGTEFSPAIWGIQPWAGAPTALQYLTLDGASGSFAGSNDLYPHVENAVTSAGEALRCKAAFTDECSALGIIL
jgi:hypothetical protein